MLLKFFGLRSHLGLVGHGLCKALKLLHTERTYIHGEILHPCGEVHDNFSWSSIVQPSIYRTSEIKQADSSLSKNQLFIS